MDNPIQTHHVFDPALSIQHNSAPQGSQDVDHQQQPPPPNNQQPLPPPGFNPDGTPIKRRPGRPKGSTKKVLLGGSPAPPKIKRPVGRPRKDGYPAGSVGGVKMKKERSQQPGMSVPYGAPIAGVGYPPIPYGFSISAPMPPAGIAPIYHIEPPIPAGDNEWADLARSNPNAFLSVLLAALAAPNPVSNAGPTVEEAFKSHLVSLAPNPTQAQPIPSLYSILKTFWLPSSPAYFSLTASASTARTPSEHRFLYWDPQPLVFNGIACPSCASPLINKGRISSGPVKIYDIEKPFFIVGCEYVCRSPMCISATGSAEGRKYASTDPSILRSLPQLLRDEFPARLLLLNGDADAGSGPSVWNWKAMGVSTGLWNLVIGGLRTGLKKDTILRLIWSVQHKVPEGAEGLLGPPPPHDPAAGNPGGPVDQAHMQPQNQPSATVPVIAHGIDDKMDEDLGDEEEQSEQPETVREVHPQNHNASSSTFANAFGDAWKENTTIAHQASGGPPALDPSASSQHQQVSSQQNAEQEHSVPPLSAPPTTVHSPVTSPPTSTLGVPPSTANQSTPATGAATPMASIPDPSNASSPPLAHSQHSVHQQPLPAAHQAQAQQYTPPPPPHHMMHHPSGYNPYTPYPFAQFTYMPHVTGQLIPVDPAAAQAHAAAMANAAGGSSSANANAHANPNGTTNGVNGSVMTGVNGSATPSAPTGAPASGTTVIVQGGGNKRSPRHCCKCGSQVCKGKGGRAFCMNPCQDCGKLDCKGRNSRRPDKKCAEGWS